MIRFFNAHVLFPVLEKKSGRLIAPKLKELREFESLTSAEQESMRRKLMHDFVSHCVVNVPYYQKLQSEIKFNVASLLKDIKYIGDFPILTKEEIRLNTESLRLSGATHPRKTGGSTGESVLFYYDDEGLDWTAAINARAYEMARNYPSLRDCHISSELNLPEAPLRAKVLDWLKLFSQNRKRLMIRSFSEMDISKTVEDLLAIRPYLLQGHPSSAYAIAMHVKVHGKARAKYFDVFEPSGETMTKKVADALEEYLGCKVVNRYGSAEFGVVAHSKWEDDFTKLKVFNRAFYLEECSKGDLIITNFTNRSFPLIRYSTGDIGSVTNEADGTYIYGIQGRLHDLVLIDNVPYATHFIMDYLDHNIRNVREFQIHVRRGLEPVLVFVPEAESDAERIKFELEKRWPRGIQFQASTLDQLHRVGWQNKFRHVVELAP